MPGDDIDLSGGSKGRKTMEFNEDIQGLRALIEEQQRAIDEQARQITDLRARLDGNGGAGDASSAHQRDGSDANAIEGGELQAGLSVVDDDHDGRTDRRGLLRQAGAAVAGVAAGAVVMGQVSPAAAAQGTFDGNPAVLGTANPNTGLGVRGDTITGTGVQGRSQAAAGPAIGVEGLVAGTNSTGVRGIATAASSATIGVLGQVSSTSGVAVKAVNQSSTGSTVGVRAEVESPSGVGVVANNASPTGDAIAIAGVNGSPTGTAIVANALAAIALPNIVEQMLETEIGNQAEDGAWWPGWHWGQYEDVWEVAKKEWAGRITLDCLHTLKNFGKL